MSDNNHTDKRSVLFIALAAILIPAIRLLGSFYPDQRLWGINHAAYIDGLWLIYPILIINAVLIYLKRRKFEQSLSEKTPVYLLIILAVVSAAAFYLFSVKEYFLGDGHYLIASLSQPEIGLKFRELGEMLLHKLYMESFFEVNDFYAYLSYKHLSIAAGIIYVVAVIHYGRKITDTTAACYAFIALSLTAAGTLLFYGYVENYSLLTAALFVFFLSGAASLKEKKFSLLTTLIFPAAVFLHSMALVFLPAWLLYLFLFAGGKKYSGAIVRHSGKIIAILSGAMILVYIGIKAVGPPFWKLAFLSPVSDRFTIDNYSLLSTAHIGDYLNLLTLLIPLSIVVFAMRIIIRPGKGEDSPPETAKVFLITGAVSGLVAAFIIEPKLGMARDWDMVSVFLTAAFIAGVFVWVTQYARRIYFQAASILLLIMQMSVLIPWLAINNSPDALYDYNISMMELDPKHGRAGFFRMISYNDYNRHPVEAARLKLYTEKTFPEMWLNKEAMALMVSGEMDGAVAKLDSAIENNPGFFSAYLNKAVCYMEKNDPDSALAYLAFAGALNPYNTFIHAFRGLVLYQTGHENAAQVEWLKSIEFDARNPLPFLYLGNLHLGKNQSDSAAVYITQYPGPAGIYPVYYLKGTSHLMESDSATIFDRMAETFTPETDSLLEAKTTAIISDLKTAHSQ